MKVELELTPESLSELIYKTLMDDLDRYTRCPFLYDHEAESIYEYTRILKGYAKIGDREEVDLAIDTAYNAILKYQQGVEYET